MPWKGIKDVYKIWLSEVILQQTRVEQGTAYYERILRAFPTVFDLASAPEAHVFKLWEGLGYYSRCRNLHATAKYIVAERNGIFPDSYEELLRLKGVGPYTAAAIASFAYNLPKPVVDGNVIRVLSRFYGLREPADNIAGKKQIEKFSAECIDVQDPASYNQAIMDFGATVCKPANPLCSVCCMQKKCFANNNNAVNQLPVLEKKLKKKTRWLIFFILRYKNKIALRQRNAGDVWAGLYEFPSMEFTTKSQWISFQRKSNPQEIPFLNTKSKHPLSVNKKLYRQQLTHQNIYAKTISLEIPRMSDLTQPADWTNIHQTEKFAFPKMIRDIIKNETDINHE